MNFDFSGITPKQAELLTFQGWQVGSMFPAVQPSKRTVKKLIERGLVIPHERKWRGVTVTEYEVPIAVHMAWCYLCSERR